MIDYARLERLRHKMAIRSEDLSDRDYADLFNLVQDGIRLLSTAADDQRAALVAQNEALREAQKKRLPRFFNTDGMHPYERSESEVRQTMDYGSETARFTVVEEDPVCGYIIKVGGNQPRPWVIEELQEMLKRDYPENQP